MERMAFWALIKHMLKTYCKRMRFYVPKTSCLSICKAYLLNAAKKLKIKKMIALVWKLTLYILDRVFRTLKRLGAFWTLSEKMLEKLFPSPKSLEIWYNTSLGFKNISHVIKWWCKHYYWWRHHSTKNFLSFKVFLCLK